MNEPVSVINDIAPIVLALIGLIIFEFGFYLWWRSLGQEIKYYDENVKPEFDLIKKCTDDINHA